MFKRAMSVTVVCTLIVLSLFSLAGPATAAKPTHFTDHRITFVCEDPPITNDFGTATVAVQLSEAEGPFAFVEYLAAPETGESDLFTTVDVPEVTGTAEHLEAVVPMQTDLGDPAGNATIIADLAPVGEPEEGETSHDGNRMVRDRSFSQALVVTSGTLSLPNGVTFDLAGCPGSDLTIDLFFTAPKSFVFSNSGVLVLCDIATDDYLLNLAASNDETGTGALLIFSNAAGTFEGHHSDLTLTPEEFTGTIELADDQTGEPVGNAIVDASLTRLERIVLDVSEPGQKSKITGWLLGVSGTITIPTDPATVVDLSSCFAVDGRQQNIVPPQQGSGE